MLAALCSTATADVDLVLSPGSEVFQIGDEVRIEILARPSEAGSVESFSAIECVLTWNPAQLRLDAIDDDGGPDLLFSGFPSGGLNEAMPPADGDALYVALARLGGSVGVSPPGTVVATLVFTAVIASDAAVVDLAEPAGDPVRETVVYGADAPNQVITGKLNAASFAVRCSGADFAAPRGEHDYFDVVAFLESYGSQELIADVNNDGVLNYFDVAAFLLIYGEGCP